MTVPDVFFYEAFEEETEALRRHLPGTLDAGFTWKTIQEQGDDAPGAGLISTRTQSVLPPEWASCLRGVLTRSTGYDHVLAWREAASSEVAAGCLPLYCHRAVAEQAMLLWTALLRKLPLQQRQFRRFHRDGLTGSECRSKRLLVVGVGNVGSEVARIGQGLDMDVRGVDLKEKHAFVDYTTLDESLPWADVIVCAMSLNEGNVGYFSDDVLRRAKPGAVFVNVARGEMSPSSVLLARLDAGHLGGVGLDVYDHESALAMALREGRVESAGDDPEVRAALALAERPDAILTPHNAFNTHKAVERKAAQSVEQVVHFLEHGAFLWPVPGMNDE